MSDILHYHIVDSAAVITLNRPDKRNALSRALITAIGEAFDRAAADPLARAVILTGNGSAFCAGMDLDELRGTIDNAAESELVWDDAARLSGVFEKIYALPKPTIAAVNGVAVAGGAGLASVCDIALAVPEAKFGYPEVKRGLVAAMVLPHLLRHVGERMARWLLLTGNLISAEQARQVGLINDLATRDELLPACLKYASIFAEAGPKALATTKDLLARCSQQAVSVQELAHASAEPRLTEECQEGLKAFFEQRPPQWKK